ncbi:MAG: hypothetical protein RBU37_27245 [Myxococcota bacterium]|jgi:hypothetical protein|nr:hypothetical protein [Myxococcota bacterium]
MPKKFMVLLGWMILGIVVSVVLAVQAEDASSWVSVAISGLLLLGLVAGSEGVRTWLMFGAGFSVLVGVLGAVLLLSSGRDEAILPAILVLALRVAPSAYMLWCLSRMDVQDWMLRRSLKMDEL